MKKCLCLLLISSLFLHSQAQKLKLPEVEALHRYEMIRADTVYRFYAIKPPADLKYEVNRSYTGFNNDSLFITEGSVTGKLLHGSFSIYYPNGNLRQKGNHKYGLKNGVRKDGNPSGELIHVSSLPEEVLTEQKKRQPMKSLIVQHWLCEK